LVINLYYNPVSSYQYSNIDELKTITLLILFDIFKLRYVEDFNNLKIKYIESIPIFINISISATILICTILKTN
jgi:hypothetical protein